ncbi:MAG: hypothetical protein A3H44_11705 [Gammaproteobacteria bacterium RIFCSPLOWO2_02_FULL_57_10]|nr:MAG: hypothetical protein A3H44_11705 [Gammaproteobacteria bacterium RIFCSPLOWO2_02_FULL_57_10]
MRKISSLKAGFDHQYHHRAQWSAVLLTLCLTTSVQAADEPDPLLRLPDLPAIRDLSAWSWLEARRDNVSRNVSGIGRSLDDWLAGDTIGERTNESYLRLKVNQQVSSTGAYDSNLRLSGRVDLPRATERWKLIFESEESELESIRDQRLTNIRPSSFSGGFSYEGPARDDGLRFSHDVGVKGDIPLDPFYRFRTRYGHDINETWFFGVDHKIRYYHSEGWSQDARFFFSRDLTTEMFLRVDSEVHYRDDRNEFEFAQTVSVHRTLGNMETLTYEGGVIALSQPNPRVESYYTQAVYRKAIHEDWLIMELVPQLIMEREEDWDPDPRFQFNLEIYFFDF